MIDAALAGGNSAKQLEQFKSGIMNKACCIEKCSKSYHFLVPLAAEQKKDG